MERLPLKKSRPYLLVALLFGVVGCMFFLSKCSYTTTVDSAKHPKLKKSGGDTLDVAIEISPLSYFVSEDTVRGLDYEMLNELAAMGNRAVKYHVFASLDQAVEGMLADSVYDIIISSLPATEQLKEDFTLTIPVYLDRQVLVQKKGTSRYIETPEQLANDSVWIADGSPFQGRIRNLSDEIGAPISIIVEKGHSAEHLIMLVATGRLPRAVVSESLARRMKEKLYPDLDISTPVSFTQFQSWIVNPSDKKLVDSLNARIDRFIETDAYQKLIDSYKATAVSKQTR